jgi:hypothetical protein
LKNSTMTHGTRLQCTSHAKAPTSVNP